MGRRLLRHLNSYLANPYPNLALRPFFLLTILRKDLRKDLAMVSPQSLSVVVPTYREAKNLPLLIKRLDLLVSKHGWDLELLIMDDDSRDGSEEIVRSLKKPWVKFVTRTQDRGLSPAVLDGFCLATREKVIVMDADLSHPPESIPDMLTALDRGHDFVLGSRYVPGASTDDTWGLFRWMNSKIATLLAYPLVSVTDPMSGFFAINKCSLSKAPYLNPVGYKIGLELLVKCGCKNVHEIPIHFANRVHGESKLSLKEQLRYLQHLRRLYIFKFAEASYLSQFLVVGASGVFTNLVLLTLLLQLGVKSQFAVASSILGSMLGNFALNRRFTFSYARAQNIWKHLVGFLGACSAGALANYVVTVQLLESWANAKLWPQTAALAGIAVGTVFNYVISRFLVFKRK